MTDVRDAPLKPWLAALIGVAIFFLLAAVLDTFGGGGRNLDVGGAVQALVLVIATGVGAYAAARLSGRETPAWFVAAAGLVGAIAYLYLRIIENDPAPLWLAASLLGSPLIGTRLGAGAAGQA